MKKFIKITIVIATMLSTCPAFAGGNNCTGIGLSSCIVDGDYSLTHDVAPNEELTEIYAHLGESAKWLGYARNAYSDNTFNIKTCREELAKAPGATLRTIGTSEYELHELMIAGYLAEAKKWWGYAEDRLSDNSSELQYCLENLEKAGATLESIGGSEEEFFQLLYDGYIAEAKKWFNYFIESDDGKIESRFFLEALIKAARVQLLIDYNTSGELEE